MDYSPLLPPCENTLQFEADDPPKKVPLSFEDESDVRFVNSYIMEGSKGFFRRSSKKTEDHELGSPSKKSNPIEIKNGSPAHALNGSSNDINNSNSSSNKEKESSSSSGSFGSFFKVLRRRNSTSNQGKHKKMTEKWLEPGREPVLEGVTFCVKFLGSTLTEKASAVEATKTVIQMNKAGHKPGRLGLTVSATGITLRDPSSGEIRLEISIYDIAHCSLDASHSTVFSFIATDKNDVNECYCFSTRKRKMAQHIVLTIAEAFNTAFQIWQNSAGTYESDIETESKDGLSRMIVGSSDSARSNASTGSDIRDWVSFDQDNQGHGFDDDLATSFGLVTLSPFHTQKRDQLRLSKPPGKRDNNEYLICLN